MDRRSAPLFVLLVAFAAVGCGDDVLATETAAETTDASETDATGTDTSETTAATSDAETTGSADPSTSDPSTTSDDPSATGDETATTDTDADTDTDDAPVYPVPDWDVVPPEDEGFDPDALEEAALLAAEHDSNCLVITRRGVIVGEWYWGGWDQDTQGLVFSVTKSFTSAVFGIAQARGELDIEEPAANFIDEWVGTGSEAVLVRDLLSNDSGRHWDFTGDYVTMTFSEDRTQYAVDLAQQHPPGTWWEYNNAAIQTLERVFKVATAIDLGAYGNAHLLDPLGMEASFGYDGAGNTLTYADLVSSCRDLARFGYLYLRGGRWADGVQLVPEAWVTASTTPSTTLNDAYGYLWWLNRDGHFVKPSTPLRKEGDGLLIPEAPAGAFTAQGLKAQLVAVEPETEIVFTRIAEVPPQDLFSDTPIEGLLWGAIMAAVDE
ncbi:MAG: serine hydrolase [Myxococcales bacterium]|nr:serine hydrolase [Myxococcales bacterium]